MPSRLRCRAGRGSPEVFVNLSSDLDGAFERLRFTCAPRSGELVEIVVSCFLALLKNSDPLLQQLDDRLVHADSFLLGFRPDRLLDFGRNVSKSDRSHASQYASVRCICQCICGGALILAGSASIAAFAELVIVLLRAPE